MSKEFPVFVSVGGAMKRRACLLFCGQSIFALSGLGCSIKWEDSKNDTPSRSAIPAGGASGTGYTPRASRNQGPTDLKTLDTLLKKSGCPLSEGQINYFLGLERDADFSAAMKEALDAKQLEAIKTGTQGRRGGRRGRRRR